MKNTLITAVLVVLYSNFGRGQNNHPAKGMEPDAGSWKTFVIASGAAVPLPPPPGKQATQNELKEIVLLQQKTDSATLKEIHYWNAGPPVYRWQKIAHDLLDTNQYWIRVYAYMNAAIYDATIAAWNTKYMYNRARPYEASGNVKNLVSVSLSPSYPCDHSVTSGAAATVLGFLFPAKKDSLLREAHKAGLSRIAAGVQYPSDVQAGFELGVKVAKEIIARAEKDGYAKPWPGTVPKGREYYSGKPLKKDLAGMKTWVLSHPGQFRSPPPPDLAKDMEELKAYKANEQAKSRAYRWEFSNPWGDVVDQKILEYNLANNPPRAAFVYALIGVSDYDFMTAHWDSKYTYYRARPNQFDTTFVSLFTTPPSPSYPAGHAIGAYTDATVLSFLFPYDRAQFFEMAKEATHSRFEAGVHYKSDNIAGEALGRRIGEEVVKWAKGKTTAWK
jgi:membrane-associated phospholipid phosphatase